LRLVLDSGIDEVRTKQLPSEVTEYEDPTPNEGPPEYLDIPTHGRRLNRTSD
jgi:hypothetical protein